jgi:2-acylglycerol O-acyltransferase 2
LRDGHCCSTFPHGLISFGAFGNFALPYDNFDKLYPGIRPHCLTLESNFYYPVRREFFLMLGGCALFAFNEQ